MFNTIFFPRVFLTHMAVPMSASFNGEAWYDGVLFQYF